MNLLTPRIIAWVVIGAIASVAFYQSAALVAWTPGPVASFWVLALTAAAALWYGWLTYLLFRKDYIPVIVVSFRGGVTIFRNVGHGAALNISLIDSNGRKVTRSPDLARDERHEVGMVIRWTLERGRFVFYQDAYGRWYATKCLGQGIAEAPEIPVSNAFVGRVYNPPKEARRAALVRDVFEHWVQLNRSWDPRNWVRRAAHWYKKWRAEKRIVGMIRDAIREGTLNEPFHAADVSRAIDLESVIAERFLANHTHGNIDGERVFFAAEGTGFRLRS